MLVLRKPQRAILFLCLLICAPLSMYGDLYPQSFECENANISGTEDETINQNNLGENVNKSSIKICRQKKFSYYLFVDDFINSFIEIPTSNVSADSSTVSSKYLAGRAPLYNRHDRKVGTCSASFLCMQNADGIFTDISNYLSVDNGLIVSWFTPTTLINLELDSIIHSMVTECLVVASTKIGFNPFYGQKFNMIVSSDDKKIYFILRNI